jgi:hypothetical protein
MPSPYGRQRPTTTVASASTRAANSRRSRDLPIPAGPTPVTSTHRSRSAARRKRVASIRSCTRRSTSGTAEPRVKRPLVSVSRSTCHTRSGRRLPLTVTGPCGRSRADPSTNRRVCAPTTMPPGGASAWSRAAVFTASPETNPWPAAPSAPATSPVLMPTRSSSPTPRSRSSSRFRPSIASRISTAARTARRASSSCRTGIPNTAITASPMYFSTVPPCRSSARRIASK